MLRIFYSSRIHPPIRTVSFLSLGPIRNTHITTDSNGIRTTTGSRTRATKAETQNVEVIQEKRQRRKSTKVLGVESVRPEPKQRRRRSTAAKTEERSEAITQIEETQDVEVVQAKGRRGKSANVLEDGSVKSELKQKRRCSKVTLSDIPKSDVGPDLPPWKISWSNRDKKIEEPNPDLAIPERKLGKQKDTAASQAVVFAEGGKRPKKVATMPKTQLSDVTSNNDSIENVGVKLVWSQKDLRKVATSSYLCKGTRLHDLDPLTRSLFDEYRGGEKKADYKRVNVVGSQLCGKQTTLLS